MDGHMRTDPIELQTRDTEKTRSIANLLQISPSQAEAAGPEVRCHRAEEDEAAATGSSSSAASSRRRWPTMPQESTEGHGTGVAL